MGTPEARKVHRDSIEFNLIAVLMSEPPGVHIKDVAESLLIHPFILSRWRKQARDVGSIVEILVEDAPEPLLPCTYLYQYRLYYSASGVDRVRYDKERAKGDRRHALGVEFT
jgi:transposase-like protein